jgi:hypothetical protein
MPAVLAAAGVLRWVGRGIAKAISGRWRCERWCFKTRSVYTRAHATSATISWTWRTTAPMKRLSESFSAPAQPRKPEQLADISKRSSSGRCSFTSEPHGVLISCACTV